MLLPLDLGCNYGLGSNFAVGGDRVLKPVGGIEYFCFMYLLLCTKSHNESVNR